MGHCHYQILDAVFIALGGTLMLSKIIFRFPDRVLIGKISLALLILITALAIYTYTGFGEFFHNKGSGRHFYHDDDIIGYTLGPKYFKEAGYYDYYHFIYIAFNELKNENVRVPKIKQIRNMHDLSKMIPVSTIDSASTYKAKFTPSRWESFKNDLKFFLELGWPDRLWKNILLDLGIESPPTWNILAGAIMNLLPLSKLSINSFPFIDIFLIFFLSSYFILRSFGIYPLCGYLIILSSNIMAGYTTIGGSFLRFDWLASLILAFCFLKEKKYALSGLFFGLSACFRMFPIVFFIGALWALSYRALKHPSFRKNLIIFLLSGLSVMLLLFFISIFLYGIGRWEDFLQHITEYNNFPYVFRIGLRKALAFCGLGTASSTMIGILLLIGSLAACLNASAVCASFIVGGSLMYLFSTPSDYYYIYLAIAPVFFFSQIHGATRILSLALFFVFMILVSLTPLISSRAFIMDGLFNILILVFLVSTYILFALDGYLKTHPALCLRKNQ